MVAEAILKAKVGIGGFTQPNILEMELVVLFSSSVSLPTCPGLGTSRLNFPETRLELK